MKTLIALSFLLATSAHAFVPKGVHCKEMNSGIDNGYEAIFTQHMTKVSLAEETIAGPQHLTTLNCSGATVDVSDDAQVGAGVTCSEPELRDAGYSLSLVEADGMLIAKLYEVTFAGNKPLADLACHRLNPSR